MTQGREPFKELNSSIESFERAVRARPRPEEREPGPPPQRPDGTLRWYTLLRPAVIAGLTLLAALLYFGRGERVSPQPPSRDRAGPAAVLAPTGTALVETAGDRGAAAVDVARASTELDPTLESVAGRTAGRSDTIDPDSAVATFTDVEVADAGIDVTVNGSAGPSSGTSGLLSTERPPSCLRRATMPSRSPPMTSPA